MNRRQFFQSIIAVTLVCLSTLSIAEAGARRKPNVVLIMADDLGYSELGSYGQEKIRTPFLDKLASQGLRFTDAYAGNAVCAPSRCVLMTGKHPGHAFIRANHGVRPIGQAPLPKSEITIAEILKKNGYVTGVFGKWGLGHHGNEGDPLNKGFGRFFGYYCQAHAHSYYPSHLWSDGKRISLDNEPPVPGHARFPTSADPNDPSSYDRYKGKDYAPDRINEQVLEFVRQNKHKPFFLYYPTMLPHVALHVPDEELKPYLALKWEDPPFLGKKGSGYTPHYTPRAAYAAMITRMDRYVGNIINLIDELGLADNTIVIFTSDNGTTWLKGEVDYDFFESVRPLKGLKGSLDEGGIRVPMIVRWPGHAIPGTTSDRVVGFEDVLPTLAELTGAEEDVPEQVDGISFLPTIQNKSQAERPFLYREFPDYGGQISVRMGKWKGIKRGLRKNRNAALELYNLKADIGEKKNVVKKHPDIARRIELIMRRERTIPTIERFRFGEYQDAVGQENSPDKK